MMGLVLTLVAMGLTYLATRRGPGHGLGVLMLFGYFYGLLRARFPDGFSHFIFDAAVAGLYLGFFTRRSKPVKLGRDGQTLRLWVKVLMVWPLFTIVLSPILDSQHFLIQLVGLRVAILLLPLLLIGMRLEDEDLDIAGTWVLWLNAVAFVFAVLELRFGVEPFFPRNASSFIIYLSMDVSVGGQMLPRIPATFNSAHAYSGTMVMSLPLLARRWIRAPKSRLLTAGVLLASVLGIFISAARSPVVQLVIIVALLLVFSRFSLKLLAGLAAVGLVVGYVVLSNPRFQRFMSLEDTEYVTDRMSSSVNAKLSTVLLDYPLGNGLGSAAGTSVPFFLADMAKPQHGLENEFARIAMEQGFIGLMLWGFFVLWLVTRLPPRRRGAPWVANRMMWATVLVMWTTAFIGTGLLASIPGSSLLLVWMGALVGMRRPVAAARPATAPGSVPTPSRVSPLRSLEVARR